MPRAAEDDHAARIDGIDAREDLAERALPGAVFPTERMARPGGHVEADVLERQHAGKALRHALETDGRFDSNPGFE